MLRGRRKKKGEKDEGEKRKDSRGISINMKEGAELLLVSD